MADNSASPKSEPVLWGAAAQAVALAVCYFLGVSTAGTALVVAAVLAVVAAVVRQHVTPV